MAWSENEQAGLLEILDDRTSWPLLKCEGEGANAVFDDTQVRNFGYVLQRKCRRMRMQSLKHRAVQVAARRAAVLAKLPRRSWAGIISRMYRCGKETVLSVRIFGPRLSSKYINRPYGAKRAHVEKTWKK